MLPLLIAALMPQDGDVVLSDTVVVAPRSHETVTATPAKHVVVSGAELARTGERSLPRAIGRATGVWVQETNLGGGAPVIGGLMGNQILIMVDGVRLNDSTTRFGPNQSLNTIDPYIVDSVEVIRGARSLLYGSDAVGGVVLIWTRSRRPLSRDADPDARAWQAGAGGQLNSAVGGQGSLNASWATEDHGLLGVASLHEYGDLESARGTVPNTGYGGHDLFASWEWAVGEGRTLRSTARVHRDFNVPRTDRMNTGFGQTEPQDEQWFYRLQDRRVAQVTYDDARGSSWFDAFQTRLSFRTYEERRDRQGNGSSTLRQEQDEVQTVGLGFDWEKELGASNLLTWGLDLDNDDVESSRVDTDLNDGTQTVRSGAFAPGARYTSMGAFLQDEVVSWDPWFLTVGARYSYYDFSFRDRVSDERISGDFDAFVGSAELARDLGQGYRLTAGLSQGYRAPNLDDLANDGSFGGGTELGNPNLDPERSLMAELTFAAERPLWGMTLGGYFTQIDDYIGRVLIDEGDPGETGDETYLRANTGTAEIWGVEGSVRVRLVDVQSPYSLVARVAYAKGRQFDPAVDPATGEQPLYDVPFRRIPPLHGRAGVRWDKRTAGTFLDWAEVYVLAAATQTDLHPEDVSDPRIDPNGTPAWATLNVDAGGPIATQDVRWTLGLHNLLDQEYRVHSSGFDAPGFAVIASLNASF